VRRPCPEKVGTKWCAAWLTFRIYQRTKSPVALPQFLANLLVKILGFAKVLKVDDAGYKKGYKSPSGAKALLQVVDYQMPV